MRRLVEKGADIDHQNANGETALHAACMRGTVVAVRTLLELEAKPDLGTNREETPIFYAVRCTCVPNAAPPFLFSGQVE